MPLTVEHLTSIVRFGTGVWGEPWTISCVIRWTSPTTVMLSALDGKGWTAQHRRELREYLVQAGVTEAVWHRRGRRVVKRV